MKPVVDLVCRPFGPTVAMRALSVIVAVVACTSSLHCSYGLRFTVPIHKAETSVGHEKVRDTLRIASRDMRMLRTNFTPIVPLTANDISSLYWGEVKIGYPPQSFKINFDTGSADFWVASGRSQYCKLQSCYYSLLSSTYAENGTAFVEIYALGNSGGFLSSDRVEISGAVIPQQIFGEATIIADNFLSQPFDGMMGLSFPRLARYTTPPFFNLIKEKVFDVNAFSFKLSQHGQGGSSLELGGWDPTIVKSDADIKWIPVTEKQYWKFAVDKITIGNATFQGLQGVADTGASLISVPQADLNQIRIALGALLTEEGFLLVQTSQIPSLPNFNVTIGNSTYTLTPDDYILLTEDGYAWVGFDAWADSDFWLIGDVFLSKFYTIFNVDKAAIAFVDLPVNPPTTQTQPIPTIVTKSSPTLPTPTTHQGGGASAAQISLLLLLFSCIHVQIYLLDNF